MTPFDVAFCVVGATTAVLLVLVDHAGRLRRSGREPGRRLLAVESNARWLNLLLVVIVVMVGGTTMTGSVLLNGLLALVGPLMVASVVSRLVARRGTA